MRICFTIGRSQESLGFLRVHNEMFQLFFHQFTYLPSVILYRKCTSFSPPLVGAEVKTATSASCLIRILVKAVANKHLLR